MYAFSLSCGSLLLYSHSHNGQCDEVMRLRGNVSGNLSVGGNNSYSSILTSLSNDSSNSSSTSVISVALFWELYILVDTGSGTTKRGLSITCASSLGG